MPPLGTADPDIEIIEKIPNEDGHHGYVKYRRLSNGQEWEVRGDCDYRGDCIIGAVIDVRGQQVTIRDHAHIEELKAELGGVNRLIALADVPVTPGFEGCCPLQITETKPPAE